MKSYMFLNTINQTGIWKEEKLTSNDVELGYRRHQVRQKELYKLIAGLRRLQVRVELNDSNSNCTNYIQTWCVAK
jgi:hypothetical protein